ncbi:MAG: hypothetical protein ACHQ53_13935, partial [Polyangiales bacterium]
GELAKSLPADPRPLRAREVVERLDRIVGAPVFTELMQRWVDGPQLPDLGSLYQHLGLTVANGAVQTQPDADEAWIREAIMHGMPSLPLPLASTGR